jgi:ribosomal protein L18E
MIRSPHRQPRHAPQPRNYKPGSYAEAVARDLERERRERQRAQAERIRRQAKEGSR